MLSPSSQSSLSLINHDMEVKIFRPPFKANVAVEAVRESKTNAAIAKKHELHPSQINLLQKKTARLSGRYLSGRSLEGCESGLR
jgi:hypothetical protein